MPPGCYFTLQPSGIFVWFILGAAHGVINWLRAMRGSTEYELDKDYSDFFADTRSAFRIVKLVFDMFIMSHGYYATIPFSVCHASWSADDGH